MPPLREAEYSRGAQAVPRMAPKPARLQSPDDWATKNQKRRRMKISQEHTLFYDKIGQQEFVRAVNHQELKVTPFHYEQDGKFLRLKASNERFNVPVDEYAYWFALPNFVPLETATSPEIAAVMHKAAIHAAGAYSLLCRQAVERFGAGCGVSSLLSFWIVQQSEPSVSDPAGLTPGWVSYRLRFAACYQSWLATLK
jgi:hypothetical protein